MKTTDELLDDLATLLQKIRVEYSTYSSGDGVFNKAQQLVGQIRYNIQTHDKH